MLNLFCTALYVLIATLGIENWYLTDTDMPRYNKFRVEEVILSGDNPVVVGYVLDVNPTDNNRLFTMREYSLSGDSANRLWYYNYGDDPWDDDGYAITTYRTDDTPPEERFLGVGFFQVDLEGPQQSTDESGYKVSASDFFFSSINPVEGVGGGAAESSSNQKFWIFRIEDD